MKKTNQPIEYTNLTILIPFYNESVRLPLLLNQISKYLDPKMILCVSDGSTDGGERMIAKKHPEVSVISTPANNGKSAAVAFGLSHVTTEYVMLMDADLEHLDAKQLVANIARFEAAITNGKKVDLLIFRRANDPLLYKLTRGDVLFSGERILRSDVLRDIFKQRSFEKYQLELFINDTVKQMGDNVYWVPLRSHNPQKITKWGIKLEAIQGSLDLYAGTFLNPDSLKMVTEQFVQFGKKQL